MREAQNAGKSMTIHNIPALVDYAFQKAMTPQILHLDLEPLEFIPLIETSSHQKIHASDNNRQTFGSH